MAGVTFWQFPDEEMAFLDFLCSTGEVVAVPEGPADSEDAFLPQPVVEFLERHDPSQVLIGLKTFADQRIIEPIVLRGKNLITVSVMTSCLMNYRRGKFEDANKLGQFNISATWTRLDRSKYLVVDKDPEFKKWAEKIIRWVRKHTPEWHQYKGYRVTRRVKDAIDKGELEIVP